MKVEIKSITHQHLNKTVEVYGWVKKNRRLGDLLFIDIKRDQAILQLVVTPDCSAFELANSLRNQDLVLAKGKIIKRKNINYDLANGDLELEVETLELVSKSKLPPFILETQTDALEQKRMEYRYLDFRRDDMIQTLRYRSLLNQIFRNFFLERDFIEVETPYIVPRSNGGANELEVLSQNHKGKSYSLAQSPQVYKQLLMIGGVDRYFQIAKCFRDEKSRSDRQIEFTQLDIEMSFTTKEEIQLLIETLIKETFNQLGYYDIPDVFQKMSYREAMEKYGSDKPDLRIPFAIEDVSELFAATPLEFIQTLLKKRKLRMMRIPYLFTKSVLKKMAQDFKENNNALFWITKNDNEINSSLKELPTAILERYPLKANETLLFAFDDEQNYPLSLGNLRLELAKTHQLFDENQLSFLWVEGFPMFEFEDDQIVSSHHPFTRPQDDNFYELTDLEQIKQATSMSYDLVLNGSEIGGGSLRIIDPTHQRMILEKLNFSSEQIEQYFGYFLEALSYGTPPHGGIALGIDRILTILLKKDSIRDVIAFPKTSHGTDELTKAPFNREKEN